MKIGITGGAGYIGSYLIKMLLNRGDRIISIDNETIGNYKHLSKYSSDKLSIIKGDIRDQNLLLEYWKDCDAIVHLAALSNLDLCNENPEEAISTNIFGTFQVMEAVKKIGIRKMINCSSAAVYGEPVKIPITEDTELNALNLYGVTKIAGEKIVNSYRFNDKIETTNLRFGNIYGVGLYTQWYSVIPKFVKQAINDEDITIYGSGEATRDYIHIEDIANIIVKILDTKSIEKNTFNLGGETLTVNQIAYYVVEEVKKSLNKESKIISTVPRQGETEKFSYDLTPMRTVLEYDNKWSVREGIRQLIEYGLKE